MRRIFQPFIGYATISFTISIVMLNIFSSCKKESVSEDPLPNPSYNILIPKIESWLDAQKIVMSTDSRARIDSLKRSLNFNEMHLEKYKDSKEFIVIPVF